MQKCVQCGSEFAPEERGQQICSWECWQAYTGMPPDSEEDVCDLSEPLHTEYMSVEDQAALLP